MKDGTENSKITIRSKSIGFLTARNSGDVEGEKSVLEHLSIIRNMRMHDDSCDVIYEFDHEGDNLLMTFQPLLYQRV